MKLIKSLEQNGFKLKLIEKNNLFYLEKSDNKNNTITSIPVRTIEKALEAFDYAKQAIF